MSSIDFTQIRKLVPEREAVWKRLEVWDQTRKSSGPVILIELIRQLHEEIAPATLMAAITDLIESGVVEKVYQIVDPAMQIVLPEVYQSREDIPTEVQNNWDHWIIVDPSSIHMAISPVPHV